LTIGVMLALLLAATSACRPGTPVVDMGPKPPTQNGTIAGKVSGPKGESPLVNRLVRAVSISTGQRYEAQTNQAGTYTIEVPPGRYKLELELQEGERLVKQPGEVQIDRSDLDERQDFVVTVGPAKSG
jgi:hypothetical protein